MTSSPDRLSQYRLVGIIEIPTSGCAGRSFFAPVILDGGGSRKESGCKASADLRDAAYLQYIAVTQAKGNDAEGCFSKASWSLTKASYKVSIFHILFHAFREVRNFLGVPSEPFGWAPDGGSVDPVGGRSGTFEKCSILVKVKEGKNFNRSNILNISRIEI